AHVDASDVSEDEIFRIDGLTADLGVEVQPAGGEAAALDQLVERERQLRRVVRELIRIPPQQRVASVDVERSEDAEGVRHRDFVLEGMPSQDRVIFLEIELDVLLQPEMLEEAVDGRRVEIVLVLGGFLGLGLDQNGTLEADLVLVLDHEGEKAS